MPLSANTRGGSNYFQAPISHATQQCPFSTYPHRQQDRQESTHSMGYLYVEKEFYPSTASAAIEIFTAQTPKNDGNSAVADVGSGLSRSLLLTLSKIQFHNKKPTA